MLNNLRRKRVQTLDIGNLFKTNDTINPKFDICFVENDVYVNNKTTNLGNMRFEKEAYFFEYGIIPNHLHSIPHKKMHKFRFPYQVEKIDKADKINQIKFDMILCYSFVFTFFEQCYYKFLREQKRQVIEKPFLLGETQVTQGLYEMIMEDNPSKQKAKTKPATNVSWYDALTFCNKLSDLCGFDRYYEIAANKDIKMHKNANGFRLPTETEWGYASTSHGKPYYDFYENDFHKHYRNFDTRGKLHSVKKGYIANDWGFYDLLGNVEEWCVVSPPSSDLIPYDTEQVTKGNGFNNYYHHFYSRQKRNPNSYYEYVGFRIAKNL